MAKGTYILSATADAIWAEVGSERINEGGGATKRASSFIYIIPSTYTGEIFGLLTYLTLGKENYGKY